MRSLLVVLLLGACGGEGAWYQYEARIVVGAPAQRVAATALPVANATTFVVRSASGEVAFPLRVERDAVVLDSVFAIAAAGPRYDVYDAPATVPAGAVALRLWPSQLDGDLTTPPALRDYGGGLELALLPATGEAVRWTIALTAVLDPCARYAEADEGAPLVSVPLLAAEPDGAPIRVEGTTIRTTPFVLDGRVQVFCSVSAS